MNTRAERDMRGVAGDDERIRPVLMEELGRDATRRLTREVARLDAFLGGEHVTNVYTSPQMRGERLG